MLARIKWYYMNIGPKEVLRSCLMPLVVLGVAALTGSASHVLIAGATLLAGFIAPAPVGRMICDNWDQIQRWQLIMRYVLIGAVFLLVARVIPGSPITFGAIVFVLGFTHGINFWGASHLNMLTERGVQELRKQASKPGSQAHPLIFIETSKPAAQRPTTNPGAKLR
jgi:hypothetical protein